MPQLYPHTKIAHQPSIDRLFVRGCPGKSSNIVMVKSLNCSQSQRHICPLQLSQERPSWIFQVFCKADTVLPYKAKELLQTGSKLGQLTLNLKGYSDTPVDNVGSCTVPIGKQRYSRVRSLADKR